MSGRRWPRRGRNLLRRGGGVALLTVLIGLVTAAPAAAHPYLLSSNPANGAILASAPATIDISYTEGLDRPYCSVVLVAPDGTHVDTHQVAASAPTELAVAPDASLSEQGTYAVNWTAVGDDGHTVIGSFGFSVGHPSANAAVQSGGTAVSGTGSSSGGARRVLGAVLPFAVIVLAGLVLLSRTLAAAGARATRLIRVAFAASGALELALAGIAISDHGLSAFGSSATGRRLIAEIALTAAAGLAGLARTSRRRTWLGGLAALALLVVLADSGHAASQPSSRRDLVLAVYSLHLLAVSIWIAAIAAVLLRLRTRTDDDLAPDLHRSLRTLVAVSLVAVLATGVATTDWGLRTLSDLPHTTYGRLALTLAGLFVVMVCLGIAASASRRMIVVEAVVAAGALVVGGVISQSSLPLDEPYASQTFAASTGVAMSVAPVGDDGLDIATLAPGIVGRNTLVLEVGHADEEDFLSPQSSVRAVTATVSCGGCGAPDQHLTLQPTGAGAEWTADVTLPRAASWLVTAAVRRAGAAAEVSRFSERVTPADLPDQVVIGVPAALSGPSGSTCRDQLLGLQVALQDLNAQAADHGDLMRVVAVDLHDGVTQAMARLHSLGARLIAMPCGTADQVDRATSLARAAGLPVVAGEGSVTDRQAGVWSTQPSWQAEGAAIANQALRQDAKSVVAVAGTTAVDQAELAGLRQGLAGHAVALRVTGFPARPRSFVGGLYRADTDVVVLLGDRTEADPTVHSFSAVNADTGWAPTHGILASAQLMSTDFINGAGNITRVGGIEFASDINPFDPIAQYYASRLRALAPGVRPTFDGVHGYDAGLLVAEALRDGGGRPSPSSLAKLLGSHFTDFTVGSYQLDWQPDGGTSTSLAFFRSTYVNPMAMPSFAPGGAAALAHEGTFLNAGGFEQVAPFRRLS
ncbi:MAG TPA: copper resistance protein CopC [Mycobacteriales bacterium]|nr:copper resistance protein CopC [Mycobacteriales bacterium]